MNAEFVKFVRLVDQTRAAQKKADAAHNSTLTAKAQQVARLLDIQTKKLVEQIASEEAALEKQKELI